MPIAVSIEHVTHEGPGRFGALLTQLGFGMRRIQAGDEPLTPEAQKDADLLVVMGGPIDIADAKHYPFIKDEIALVRERLEGGRPTLGICLGAQIMAEALGGKVRPMEKKEIGWHAVELTDRGRRSALAALEHRPVLHWHGSEFTLPPGAEQLARTDACENQAFQFQRHGLALQFHPEITRQQIEPWLVGASHEIRSEGLNASTLRKQSREHADALDSPCRKLLIDWLESKS